MIEVTWEQVRAFRVGRSLNGSGGLVETARRLSGVQAQVMSNAELALAVRVEGLSVQEVRDALWEDRELVKTWAMRGTLHLLPSDEIALWAGALRTRAFMWRRPTWLQYFGIEPDELEKLLEEVAAAIEREPLTRQEIAALAGEVAGPKVQEHLASGWGSLLKPVAMEGGLVFGPNRGRNVVFVGPRSWVGPFDAWDSDDAMREIARRWLGVYGPASHLELARWWGTGAGRARKALELLDGELVDVSVEGRRALVLEADVSLLQSPSSDGRARLVPGFDPYTVGFFPREALVEPEFLPRVSRTAGWISPVVLVGGKPVGVWKHALRKGKLEITVEPFRKLPAARRKELATDAERMAGALGARSVAVVVA